MSTNITPATLIGRKCFWFGTKVGEDGSTFMGVIQGLIMSTSRMEDGTGILQIKILKEKESDEEGRIVSLPLGVVFLLPSN
jgi:hypothetical protein